MAAPVEVSDGRSNAPEQIEYAVKAIGRSKNRLAIFREVYRHVAVWKSATNVASSIGCTRLNLIKDIRPLVQKGVLRQERRSDDIYYGMVEFFKAHKNEVIRFAENPKRLEQLATKRRPQIRTTEGIQSRQVLLPVSGFDARPITIDEIESFARVSGVKGSNRLEGMSEDAFKKGIQTILGEPGTFKDWGGETSDLYSSRLRLAGKRRTVAFAFKGPGLNGKLTVARMGKGGDQGVRLFRERADVFLVQHWREIDPSIMNLLEALAIARSVATGKTVWYGIIDGKDSDRIRKAYPEAFQNP